MLYKPTLQYNNMNRCNKCGKRYETDTILCGNCYDKQPFDQRERHGNSIREYRDRHFYILQGI